MMPIGLTIYFRHHFKVKRQTDDLTTSEGCYDLLRLEIFVIE